MRKIYQPSVDANRALRSDVSVWLALQDEHRAGAAVLCPCGGDLGGIESAEVLGIDCDPPAAGTVAAFPPGRIDQPAAGQGRDGDIDPAAAAAGPCRPPRRICPSSSRSVALIRTRPPPGCDGPRNAPPLPLPQSSGSA